MKAKRDKWTTEKLLDTLLPRLDIQESAVREFRGAESVESVNVTKLSRKATAEGTRAYFAYD